MLTMPAPSRQGGGWVCEGHDYNDEGDFDVDYDYGDGDGVHSVGYPINSTWKMVPSLERPFFLVSL